MLVKDAMTRWAEVIAPDATLQSAARKMREVGVGALAVCEHDRMIGMVTDRDIVVRATAEGRDPTVADVRGAMTAQVIACSSEDDLDRAATLMGEHAVRRVVVLDAEEHPVGVLSVDDVALYSPALAGQVIERTREPERPARRGVWPWWE